MRIFKTVGKTVKMLSDELELKGNAMLIAKRLEESGYRVRYRIVDGFMILTVGLGTCAKWKKHRLIQEAIVDINKVILKVTGGG